MTLKNVGANTLFNALVEEQIKTQLAFTASPNSVVWRCSLAVVRWRDAHLFLKNFPNED